MQRSLAHTRSSPSSLPLSLSLCLSVCTHAPTYTHCCCFCSSASDTAASAYAAVASLLCIASDSLVFSPRPVRLYTCTYPTFDTSSGVASYGALGHVLPLKFWKKINLTVKISKITKEKHVGYYSVVYLPRKTLKLT